MIDQQWVKLRIPFSHGLVVETWRQVSGEVKIEQAETDWDAVLDALKNLPQYGFETGGKLGENSPQFAMLPPLPSVSGGGEPGAGPPTSPSLPGGGGAFPTSGATRRGDPIAELSEARELLVELANRLAGIDRELGPARDMQRRLEQDIVRTHHGNGDTVAGLDLTRRDERAPLFQKLLELSIEWGPLRQERRDTALEVKLAEKLVGQIEKQAAKAKTKERSNG